MSDPTDDQVELERLRAELAAFRAQVGDSSSHTPMVHIAHMEKMLGIARSAARMTSPAEVQRWVEQARRAKLLAIGLDLKLAEILKATEGASTERAVKVRRAAERAREQIAEWQSGNTKDW